MSDWMQPRQPMFTHLFLEDMMQANAEKGKKAQAFNTPFRYSDAGKCERQMAYSFLGLEGEPFDGPSTLVTELGTMIHEWIQEAILRRYPEATFEGKSQVVTSSGHFDGIVPDVPGLGKVLLEFKSMGGTAYSKSIGAGQRGMNAPGGPRYSAILQSALNAQANGCDTIIIGHIALEAISRQKAGRLELPEWNRCISEWIIPKEVWEPLADAEIARQLTILDELRMDRLPPRLAINDSGAEEHLNPETDKSWQCVYCSYRETCITDGPDTPVNVHIKEEK